MRAGSKDGPPAFRRSDRAVGLSGEQGAERDKRIELALLVRTRLRLLEQVGLSTSPYFGEVDWRNSARRKVLDVSGCNSHLHVQRCKQTRVHCSGLDAAVFRVPMC